MDELPLKAHGELLRELASMLYGETTDQFSDTWSKMFVDIRVPRSGYGAVSGEYVLVHGSRRVLHTSAATGSLVLDLVHSRKTMPGAPWFGCLVVITAGGECAVKYDYDETCVDRLVDDHRAGKPF